MCGIAGTFGVCNAEFLRMACRMQHHRGPDGYGLYLAPHQDAGLAHNRLSIIDLSKAGSQPMSSADGRYHVAFNGEIYNYRELRALFPDYPFRSATDTEVILAVYARWGEHCLDRLSGMFAFLIWDSHRQTLFAARDRFGVKPLYYAHPSPKTLYVASEIGPLREKMSAGPDLRTWASYLAYGHTDHTDETFWAGISSLPPGHFLTWRRGRTTVSRWYYLPAQTGGDYDARPQAEVEEEYLSLTDQSINFRFRSDVPVGVNVSGGLDSSLLLALVRRAGKESEAVTAYTFVTGDPRYDELPWVKTMIARTRHPLRVCRLSSEDVPELAERVQASQHEPFGGVPTLAYARVFEQARSDGAIVLLDGQGMDEQWAGYDYYRAPAAANGEAARVQGSNTSPVRPNCLASDFRKLAEPPAFDAPYADQLRNLQYRDVRYTKMPRALRFNDRISMRTSTELREPFLDHTLFELAFRQPADRKIGAGEGKRLLRSIARRLIPDQVAHAPKRPVQTPQREWLRGPLREWALRQVESAVTATAWFDTAAVREACDAYFRGESSNSFFFWQWISVGMILGSGARTTNV